MYYGLKRSRISKRLLTSETLSDDVDELDYTGTV